MLQSIGVCIDFNHMINKRLANDFVAVARFDDDVGDVFAVIFNKIPTYDEIKFGTHKNSSLPEVNELFRIQIDDKSFDGDPTGNRTRIVRMRT